MKSHRNEILEVDRRHGVKRVRVFGSFARSDENENSDVDLLTEMGEVTTPKFPGSLIVKLKTLLGRRIDVVVIGLNKGVGTFHSLDHNFPIPQQVGSRLSRVGRSSNLIRNSE